MLPDDDASRAHSSAPKEGAGWELAQERKWGKSLSIDNVQKKDESGAGLLDRLEQKKSKYLSLLYTAYMDEDNDIDGASALA